MIKLTKRGNKVENTFTGSTYSAKRFDEVYTKQGTIWGTDDDGIKYVDHQGMIKALSTLTGLPKFICEMVYNAEDTVLQMIGIIKD